ncbi:MAG TPA: transketolase [Pseudonocardiaceae bacterium]
MTTGFQVRAMREVFGATVTELLERDPRLVVVLADISAAMLAPAAERHPDRVVNVGIREQLLISTASGLAMTGLRPVVHTFSSFLVERPFEQIKLDLNHQDVGAVLVSAGASYDRSEDGRSHQSPGDVALLDTLPGWTVYVPGHPDEADRLLRTAVAGDDRVYVRLSDQSNAVAHDGDRVRIVRQGRRGVVLAVGPMLDRVLAATESIDVAVAYTSTVRPLDGYGLRAAVLAADRADVVVVEPYLAGTSAYLVNAALDDVPHRLRSLGVSREFELRMYGTPADHDAAHGLDAAGIAAAVRSFVDRGE